MLLLWVNFFFFFFFFLLTQKYFRFVFFSTQVLIIYDICKDVYCNYTKRFDAANNSTLHASSWFRGCNFPIKPSTTRKQYIIHSCYPDTTTVGWLNQHNQHTHNRCTLMYCNWYDTTLYCFLLLFYCKLLQLFLPYYNLQQVTTFYCKLPPSADKKISKKIYQKLQQFTAMILQSTTTIYCI